MEDLLVTREIAENLKKLGFREETYHYYEDCLNNLYHSNSLEDHNKESLRVAVPVMEHASRWLRENYKNIVIIDIQYLKFEGYIRGFEPIVYDESIKSVKVIEWNNDVLEKYEDALLKGIEMAIENIQK